MKLKTQLIIGMLLTSLALAGSSFAEGLKVAYVDLPKVLIESIRGQEAKKKIEKFFDERQANLDLQQESLSRLEKEYFEQKPILTEDALMRKQDEIRNKRIDLKRLYEDAERDLEAYEARLTRKMKEDIFKLIKEIGAKEGYSLILNPAEGVVLYVDDALDITKTVTNAFDGIKDGQ